MKNHTPATSKFTASNNLLLTAWLNWVKSKHPLHPKAKAIATAIANRPAHITYMTAYRTAVMDLGVK